MEYIDIWRDRYIRGYEKLVLIYLVENYKVEYGYSYPTRKQIEVDTGIAKDTLSKVLNSLEEKGYITRATNPHKGGRNNIYYIHKYLVASKKEVIPVDVDARSKKVTDKKEVKPKLDEAPEAPADVKPEVEASTNELLVNEKAKVIRALNDKEKEYLNTLNTDILIKAIERANEFKPNGYHIGYIISCYESIENNPSEGCREVIKPKTSNKSNNDNKNNTWANTKDYYNNNYPVKTKYHGTFREHFRDYTEEELEAKLLRMQNSRKQ